MTRVMLSPRGVWATNTTRPASKPKTDQSFLSVIEAIIGEGNALPTQHHRSIFKR
jgi:hypothetical protein